MQSGEHKLRFGDIVDKKKMIEQMQQSGKICVKFIFHHDAKHLQTKAMWCDKNQPLLKVSRAIREYFKVSENDGLFFYVNKRIPDQSKPLKQILELAGGGEVLVIDIATSEIF